MGKCNHISHWFSVKDCRKDVLDLQLTAHKTHPKILLFTVMIKSRAFVLHIPISTETSAMLHIVKAIERKSKLKLAANRILTAS